MTQPRRLLGILAGVILMVTPATGLETQTEIATVVQSESLELSTARLVVRNAAGEERLTLPLGTNGDASFGIHLADHETVTCIGNGLWCPELRIPAGGVAERLVLPLFNRALFQMPISLPAGEVWTDDELQIEFWLRSKGQPGDALPLWTGADRFVVEATASNTAGGGLVASWSGPASPIDFRIAAEGWAPVYLFDVEAKQGSVKLPQTKLVRGSSLSAFAVDTETGAAIPGVTATVHLPDAEYHDERAQRLRTSHRTNDRGFVQLQGIPPGTYDLVLASEGRPPTHISAVELTAGTETWLGNVELTGFVRMTVHVEPATNNGQPWRIEAWQISEPWTQASAATSRGISVLEGLVQGYYEVRVVGAGESLMRSETRLIGADERVFLTLDLAQVEGQVLLDNDGIRSAVDLATGGGDRSRFTTDDEGRFAGSIPRPLQDWVVAFVETENAIHRTFRLKPRQHDGVYQMTLKLGNHGIRGQVLDSASKSPIEGAQVMIRHPEDEDFYPGVHIADATGSFAFRGIDADNYDLSAYQDGYTEVVLNGVPAVEMPVRDDDDRPELDGVTILLRQGAPLDILLTSVDGIPERGASASVFTLSPEGTGFGETTTDLAGRGQVVVPRSVLPAAVVVRAPSGVLWSGCASLPEEEHALHVQLPSASGGTLVLQREETGNGPPMQDQDLVSIDGGLLRIQDFLHWSASLGLPPGSGDSFEVPRLASGYYAVTETLPPGLEAYPTACQRAGSAAGTWQYLPAGGTLVLPLRFEPVNDQSFWIPG